MSKVFKTEINATVILFEQSNNQYVLVIKGLELNTTRNTFYI